MKVSTFTTLLILAGVRNVVSTNVKARHAGVAKRQNLAQASAGSSAQSQQPSAPAAPSAPGAPASSGGVPAGPVAPSGVPPLASITFGMPVEPTLPVTKTFTQGQAVPISGAPPLPTPFVFTKGEWPVEDHLPDTSSDEVQEWLKELDGFNIPDIAPTVDGSCVNDTAAANDAANRGWWTCGGYTRDTDITACPDKYTWGVSFDDGPSDYSETLLNFLDTKKLKATFFVVGSRTIERPQVLVEEYMAGHEISVHTWSHPHLTSLTNVQIVAELGWTRKAIKTILGVTPTTMRPPYGDIDDRVRAIALAMGMVPIIWTRTPTAGQFDTNDWKVAGGLVTGPDSFASFNAILGNATIIDTGFIVLQHDLFPITVDLAVGYTLNTALSYTPALTLQSIGTCSKIPATDLYLESTTNTTFPYTNQTGVDTDGDGNAETSRNASNVSAAKSKSSSSPSLTILSPIINVFSLVGIAFLFSLL